MKYINVILSIGMAFILGLYASSQFRFGEEIELSRWFITGLFFVINTLLVVVSVAKDKSKNRRIE